MKEKRTVLSAVMPAVCACGLAVITAGCSPEWIAGGAPETPPGAYIDDPAPAADTGETALVPKQDIEVPQTPEQVPAGPEEIEIEIVTPDADEPQKEAPVKPAPAKPAAPVVKEIVYTVCAGDTLSGIGESYGADWRQIAAYNKLDPKAPLRINQQIRIPENLLRQKGAKNLGDVKNLDLKPVPEKKPAAPEKKPAPQAQEGQKIHVVASGDMLSKLAVKYGVSASAIAKANGIDVKSILRIGQKLIIPAGSPAPKKAAPAPAPKKAAPAPAPKKEESAPAPKKEESAPAPKKEESAPAPKKDAPPALDDEEPAADAPALDDDKPAAALPDDDSEAASPEKIFVTTLPKGQTLRAFARDLNIDLEEIRKLNPGVAVDEAFDAPRQITLPLE